MKTKLVRQNSHHQTLLWYKVLAIDYTLSKQTRPIKCYINNDNDDDDDDVHPQRHKSGDIRKVGWPPATAICKTKRQDPSAAACWVEMPPTAKSESGEDQTAATPPRPHPTIGDPQRAPDRPRTTSNDRTMSVHLIAWPTLRDPTGALTPITDALGSRLGIPWSAEVEKTHTHTHDDYDNNNHHHHHLFVVSFLRSTMFLFTPVLILLIPDWLFVAWLFTNACPG